MDAGNAKKLKATPLGEIKSEALFNKNFAGYVINRTAPLEFTSWQTSAAQTKIKLWLRSIAPRFVTGLNKIVRNTEYSLYSLILDVILPVVELADFTIMSKAKVGTSIDQIEYVSEKVAEAQSRTASRQTSSDGNNSSTLTEAEVPSAPASSSTGVPLNIDTTDANEVATFIVEIEKQMRAFEDAFPNKGRVEIVVSEKESKAKRCMVEAKLSLRSDVEEGFYQTSAELVTADRSDGKPVYGIYTDHTYWQFLRLQNKEITCTRQYLLLRPSEEFDEDVVTIMSILFEMFGINAETDLAANALSVAESIKVQGELLTKRLH